MIQIIACDLDGTLLTKDSTLAVRSGRLLHHLWQQGMTVVLATGRSWRTALKIQQELAITGPIIAHNGAYVFDTATETDWYRRSVPLTEARAMLSFADHHHIMLRCYLGYRQPVLFNHFTSLHRRHFIRPEDRLVDQLASRLTVEPVEMFLFGMDEVAAFVRRFGTLTEHYELAIFSHGDLQEVNICAPRVDKVEGLEAVVRRLHRTPADVLALGDGQNDIGMLRWAGLAVAMGHGVPEAKAEADYIAERPHLEPVEDGILWALEHDRTVRQDVR